MGFHDTIQMYQKLMNFNLDEFIQVNLSFELRELSFSSSIETGSDKQDQLEKLLKEVNMDSHFLENYIDHKEVVYDQFIAAHWLEIIPY